MRNANPSLTPAVTTPPEWISGPRELPGMAFTLRELRPDDALLLLETLTFDEMADVIRCTPALGCDPSIWSHVAREAGTSVCFAVVPVGTDTAVGIVQMPSWHNTVVKH